MSNIQIGSDVANSLVKPRLGEEPSPVVELGPTLRARRAALGLTLQHVATGAGCAKSYLSMIESGVRTSPPSEDLLARLESVLELPAGGLLSIAHWHNTPAPVRRRVQALEGTRRAAVAQLRELLGRGVPREAGLVAKRTPGMVLDELWRTGRLQSLVDRLEAPDGHAAANVRALPLGAGAEIPLINSVAAGYPRDFTDLGYPARTADSYVRSPDVADPDAFACRVVGDSMTPEYREGDIVIFSPARDVKSGMDCFVRLEPDHESTFKRVFFEAIADAPAASRVPEPSHLRLQPLNPNYPARTVAREQIAGLYAAVSVTRRLG